MRVETTDNLRIYSHPDVAAHYAGLDYVTACECLLFEKYVRAGSAVLDIGVGGGRTTLRLSATASRYVGIDYSEEMVRLCRMKFPDLEFFVSDASDLTMFPEAAFDAIVIAFNGIDYVLPDENRWQCLRECHRVLKPGGVFIFSSHNPRALFIRPAWDRERLRVWAKKLFTQGGFFFQVALAVLTCLRALYALASAAAASLMRIARRITKSAFWRGNGHLFDPAHGGLMTHCWIPSCVVGELTRFGFKPVTQVGDDYPSTSSVVVTDWYYYVFEKSANHERGSLCA